MPDQFRQGPLTSWLFLLSILTLSGCGGGGGNASTTTPDLPTSVDLDLTGSVGDGPIDGASIRARADDGSILAEGQSDSTAQYNVSVSSTSDRYPLTIEAIGGTDLVRDAAPDFDLKGAVARSTSQAVVNLSPFSTITVELAGTLNGGLTSANLTTAETSVVRELNSGLTLDRPMSTPVDSRNLSEFVRASVTLGETVRRVRDRHIASGRPATGNSVIESLAADLVDGVIDGDGAAGADPRIAALTIVMLAETFLESMQNELRVDGEPGQAALEAAMLAVSPSGYDTALDDLTVTDEMLDAVRIGLEAALAIDPTAELAALRSTLASLQPGMTAGMIRPFVPDTYRAELDAAVSAVARGSSADIAMVNRVSRNGGEVTENTPPTISGTPVSQATVGASYTFTPSASDADGDPLTFSISAGPNWANFDTATGRLSGTPGVGDVGNYAGIVISVTDGEESTALPTFSINVSASTVDNDPPTISGNPPLVVEEGASYFFAPTANDPDGDTLTFSILNRPAWASFNASNGRLTGTPQSGDRGDYTNIIISVSDGRSSDELAPFTITVTLPGTGNAAPNISGTPATTVEVGSAYSFTPTASDPDGDPLTFSISGQPAWAAFDAATGTLSGAPAATDVGDYGGIVISVSDGQATTSLAPFAISVTDTTGNTPPVISGSPAPTVEVGAAYSFTPTASDPDGDPLVFSIENSPAWADFDTVSGTLSGTPSAGDENVYSDIVIRVSDGELVTALAPFSIEVIPADAGTGSVTLNWTAPTQNEDGSALDDLAGYVVYWGTSPGNYPNSVRIDNPSVVTYTVDALSRGTYYFVMTAFNAADVESRYSGVATKTVE